MRALILVSLLLLVAGCVSLTIPQLKVEDLIPAKEVFSPSQPKNESILNSKEFLVALLGLIVGWILSELTRITGQWVGIRKRKSALISEIKQLRAECDRLVMAISRDIQLSVIYASEPSTTAEIVAPIYSNFYKDVVLSLSESQRISYQMIHSLLGGLNRSFQDEAQLVHQIHDAAASKNEKTARLLIKKRGELAHGAYATTRMVQWHIDFHLAHPSNPSLDVGGDLHKNYLLFLDRVEQEVLEIKEGAANMEPEQFSRKFDSESFDSFFNPNKKKTH